MHKHAQNHQHLERVHIIADILFIFFHFKCVRSAHRQYVQQKIWLTKHQQHRDREMKMGVDQEHPVSL